MRGNSFGKMISMTSFGESHGEALGVVLDGVPSGLDFSLEDLQKELDRRAPGKLAGTTARKEPDKAEVLSGLFEGKTTGTPICVIVRNTNQRSGDYEKLKKQFRPGHADKTYLHSKIWNERSSRRRKIKWKRNTKPSDWRILCFTCYSESHRSLLYFEAWSF